MVGRGQPSGLTQFIEQTLFTYLKPSSSETELRWP
jgi:hypothetical protein